MNTYLIRFYLLIHNFPFIVCVTIVYIIYIYIYDNIKSELTNYVFSLFTTFLEKFRIFPNIELFELNVFKFYIIQLTYRLCI